ncbi:MAG: rod shape-determining protein MreC [Actinomycetota bacterium]
MVTLVSLSLATITIDYRQGTTGPLENVGQAAYAVITPLQTAVSKITRPIGAFLSALTRLPELQSENESLRQQLEALQADVAASSTAQQQLEELQGLLELRGTLANAETVGASVIGASASNFEWTITIDKGSGDGIEQGMPVLASAGLAGSVVHVTPWSSSVRLIIDPDSNVAGQLQGSGQTGILQGQGVNDLRMTLVRAEAEVKANELVLTKGYRTEGGFGSRYPQGVVIGRVSRILASPGELEKFITVRPAVDFSNLSNVLVVLSRDAG